VATRESGAVHWRHRAISKIAEELEAVEARYQKLQPLTPEQETERQREMREAVRKAAEAAVDSAYLSDDPCLAWPDEGDVPK